MTSKSRSMLAVSAAIIALTLGVSASSMAAAHKEKDLRGQSASHLGKHGKALKFKHNLREVGANEVILSATTETATATTETATATTETATATTETATATTDDTVETATATTDHTAVATAPQPTITPFPGGAEGDVSAKQSDEAAQISRSTPPSTLPSPQRGSDHESD